MIDIVVFTCAQYAHLIPKWLTMFYRTFSSQYQLTYVVAGTNRIEVPVGYNKSYTKFVTMRDGGFAANILDYLSDKSDPFLMFMDDHMLFEMNPYLIREADDIIWREDVGCVRLVPWPGPTLPYITPDSFDYETDNFGEIDKKLEYAVSLQASLWKPRTLKDLLDRSWNPWQIELEGSKRAANYGKRFIGCKSCAVNYRDYMMRGKPRPEHAAWVDEHLGGA